MDVERLSFTPDGYCKLPSNAGGKLSAKQFFFNKHEDIYKQMIIRSKDEFVHSGVLKNTGTKTECISLTGHAPGDAPA